MAKKETDAKLPETIAAIDLGSNSFHMIVAQIDNGQLVVIDRLKEMVRLGEGLDKNKNLTPEVRERALECLSRFGERLRDLPADAVRAVGTNTLRQIRDNGNFLHRAQEALGHSIQISAGREEARLVYLGVAHGHAAGNEKRLVVDIGGGSTELIIGRKMDPLERESLFMGCVNFTQRFFPDGKITRQAMRAAIIAGRLEVRPVQTLYNAREWEQAVGSSGTIKSIRDVVQAAGWSAAGISRKSLKKLRRALIDAGSAEKIIMEGVSENRRPVFAGGVAVLSAVFKALDIKQMRVSDMALREGLLYELLGSIQQHDVRERTVDSLVGRYDLDVAQGNLVAATAAELLAQVAAPWGLTDRESARALEWAARLHEIGLVISHSGFHKHGAYILANADLPGFSRQLQTVLSTLVRGHRRKVPLSVFTALATEIRESSQRLCIILRLSVLLHRGRTHTWKPSLGIQVIDRKITLTFPGNWLEKHPLTLAELVAETRYLKAAGYQFVYE